jgi:hypothetical protein
MWIGFLGSKLPQRSTNFKKVLFYLLISTHGEVNSYLLVLLFAACVMFGNHHILQSYYFSICDHESEALMRCANLFEDIRFANICSTHCLYIVWFVLEIGITKTSSMQLQMKKKNCEKICMIFFVSLIV